MDHRRSGIQSGLPAHRWEGWVVRQDDTDGLAAACEQRLVHRDVTPGNIFVTKDGQAKLLDVDLARYAVMSSDPGFASAPTAEALAEKGAVVGSVSYMSHRPTPSPHQ